MTRARPISVTIISWLYIIAGAVGLAYHSTQLNPGPNVNDALLVCTIRALAVMGGIYALRGKNWARWLLIAWMALHVLLSAFHSIGQTLTHALFLAAIGYFLLQPRASSFFANPKISAN